MFKESLRVGKLWIKVKLRMPTKRQIQKRNPTVKVSGELKTLNTNFLEVWYSDPTIKMSDLLN